MNLTPLNSVCPAHKGALAQLVSQLADQLLTGAGSLALAAIFLVRFVFLSTLACLLFTSPISPNEVPYASHRPSSGH